MSKLLYTGGDWTIEKIENVWEVIDKIAKEKYGLDYYSPQIEIVTADQMIARHASGAMPIMYNHWSFGKSFIELKKEYIAGRSSLSYETIINTNPTLAFIMEDNTMTMQCLVLAHAVCGHGSFFKVNDLFKRHTDADYILDYLKFAQNYINKCEEQYGPQRVELILDSCHALRLYGVDKTTRRRARSEQEIKERDYKRKEDDQTAFRSTWKSIPTRKEVKGTKKDFNWAFPEENLLYFIEKNSPILEDWEKEIVRIVRKIAQYFYPQYQTKMMNEGWASFWHHTLMTDLWEEGYIDDGSYMEFLTSHTGVCCQRGVWEVGGLIGFNPYALGFTMYKDIQRICMEPTEEDKEWFPDLIGRNWLEVITEATVEYRDESFVAQFLSPKVMRDMRMFSMEIGADAKADYVTATQDGDYKKLRSTLSNDYNFNNQLPRIEIVDYNHKGDRSLTLTHYQHNGVELDAKQAKATAKHLRRLWGKPIRIQVEAPGERTKLILKRDY